jgi:hypothetical protein
MAHPWHLVMMGRHREIAPLVRDSAAVRAFLGYYYGAATCAASWCNNEGCRETSTSLLVAEGLTKSPSVKKP